MNHEYYPVTTRLSLNGKLTIAFLAAYTLAPAIACYWIFFIEPEAAEAHPVLSIALPAAIALMGMFSARGIFYGLRPTSIKTDSENIHIVHGKRTTSIPFNTITELDIYPEGELFFYTKETHGTGPYAITDQLSDSTLLEVVLTRELQVNRPDRIPFIYNPLWRFVIAVIAYVALILNFLTGNPELLLMTAAVYTLCAVVNVAIIFAYRKKGNGMDIPTLVVIAAVTIFMLIRTAVIL